jgi:hypothetical protein
VYISFVFAPSHLCWLTAQFFSFNKLQAKPGSLTAQTFTSRDLRQGHFFGRQLHVTSVGTFDAFFRQDTRIIPSCLVASCIFASWLSSSAADSAKKVKYINELWDCAGYEDVVGAW